MLEELKQKVYEANMELPAKGLITYLDMIKKMKNL